jgi:hypothetical protein
MYRGSGLHESHLEELLQAIEGQVQEYKRWEARSYCRISELANVCLHVLRCYRLPSL